MTSYRGGNRGMGGRGLAQNNAPQLRKRLGGGLLDQLSTTRASACTEAARKLAAIVNMSLIGLVGVRNA